MCKCMKVSKNAYYHWYKRKDIIRVKSLQPNFLKKELKLFFMIVEKFMVVVEFNKC